MLINLFWYKKYKTRQDFSTPKHCLVTFVAIHLEHPVCFSPTTLLFLRNCQATTSSSGIVLLLLLNNAAV